MHADHSPLAFAHFDRDLRRLPSIAEARPWLTMYLLCTGLGNAVFCEIRTRFQLLADGRLRQQSLAVAKRVKAVQRAWYRDHGVDPRLGSTTELSSVGVPVIPPVDNDVYGLVVVDQVLLDIGLRPLSTAGTRRRPWMVVALVHPRGLPAWYECWIRIAGSLVPSVPRVRDRLAICRTIAVIQQQWTARYAARFYCYGTINDYVFVDSRDVPETPETPESAETPLLVRAYGGKSRVVRQEDVGAHHAALDIIAHTWDAWAMNPQDAEELAFGVERVWNVVSEVATTITRLLAVVEERAQQPNAPLPSDEQELRAKIQSSCVDSLLPYLSKILRPHLERQEEDESKPDAVTTVHTLILRVLDNDALTRFDGAHAPRLTRPLVQQVGKTLGYIDAKRPLRRPKGPKTVNWFVDTRLEPLIADMLAERYHENSKSLLRTLVRPSMRGAFSGLLAESDEARVRG